MPTPEEMARINKERTAYSKEVHKTAYSKIGAFIEKILAGNIDTIGIDELVYSDARHEDHLRNVMIDDKDKREELDATSRSSLTFDAYNFTSNDEGQSTCDEAIKGIIDGKKIKIKRTGQDYQGEIDGQKITKEDAELIANKYFPIARDRSRRIKNDIDEKNNTGEKRKFNKAQV